MTAKPIRAFELEGEQAASALDWLHVHADVQGVEEGEHSLTVYLSHELPPLPYADLRVRELPLDQAQLAVTGLEHDRPIEIAADLLVRPPWVPRPAGFVGIELLVPRAGAFGSGEHASTRAALRCLHRLWPVGARDQASLAPVSLADIGTGSGILALYAATRGCQRIEACDIDAPSVAAAQQLLPTARIVCGGPDLLNEADAVIANMTADELRSVMPAMLRLWNRRDVLVLSGMRAHEVAMVLGLVPHQPTLREVVEEFTAVGFVALPAHDVR